MSNVGIFFSFLMFLFLLGLCACLSSFVSGKLVEVTFGKASRG